ncbi:hypothetical protein NIES2119_18615 [[Phormidium ambiguum] IAM M-71]|uniref:Uncharacterized protein n=1 Tax=[Phormidium ambiguum] IAM M-71 TaxID=454136 RepID=A0A1U7IG76_9CYAN|nr:hypothetical protein [Phormidium ambiguum]OKH36010.1 hypothetical protein NIES2119_18615 [Phormidium ambiguum IAM M-71]
MAQQSASSNIQDINDAQIWDNLKEAIASCSGFERWQYEQQVDEDDTSLDYRVRRYLRETLETLAY